MSDITLQINLSPGDVAFASLTVPRLVEAHRGHVRETLAVVDCCKPQRTRMVDPERRCPEPDYSHRRDQICAMAERFRSAGLFDRVAYLRPDSPDLKTLSWKYMRRLIPQTHDFCGIGLMSYWLGYELTTTRYLLHYDADMLLYQADGYEWPVEALRRMSGEKNAVYATCRQAPPVPWNPEHPPDGYRRTVWFSTRCFLADLEKLRNYFPLIRGRYLLEVLLRKMLDRTYPPASESIVFHRLRRCGAWRLDLYSPHAWVIHPASKPPEYLRLLPRIMDCVRQGRVPLEQGWGENIVLSAWQAFLQDKELHSCESARSPAPVLTAPDGVENGLP